jgi:hypothetical protein
MPEYIYGKNLKSANLTTDSPAIGTPKLALLYINGNDMPPMLVARLAYAALGWSTFPAVFPANGQKKSLLAKAHSASGVNWGATRDPDVIRAEFAPHSRRLRNQYAAGLPTGEDVVVIEIDIRDGVDGAASLKELETKYGVLPETLMAQSPSVPCSIHYYFEQPPGVRIKTSASAIGPGIDVRGHGGMVIVPPSYRPPRKATKDKPAKAGGYYEWINPDCPIAKLPQQWIDLVVDTSPIWTSNRVERNDLNAYQLFARESLSPSASKQEAIAALKVIPADKEVIWAEVFAALCAGFGDAGFELAHEWSKTSRKYVNEADCRRKWLSVQTSYHFITIKKLFDIADQFDPNWRRITAAEMPQQKVGNLLPYDEGVAKLKARIAWFIHDVVIGKARNVWIDFGIATQLDLQPNEALPERAVAIVGPPGTKKSSMTREEIAQLIKAMTQLKKVVVLVPRLRFANEWQREFAALGVRSVVLRGRSKETCLEMEKVELVTSCGFKIWDALCASCPHLWKCPYTAAMKEKAPVWIACSNYLFFEQSVLKDADFLIIDETFAGRGMIEDVERFSIPLNVLAEASTEQKPDWRSMSLHDKMILSRNRDRRGLYNHVLRYQKHRGGIEQESIDETFNPDELRHAEISERDVLKQVLQPRLQKLLESKATMSMRGVKRMMKTELVREIRHAQTMILIWHELRNFIHQVSYDQSDAPVQSGRVMIEGKDEDRALVWCGISRITKQYDVPILLLNIEHEEEIVKTFIPHIEPAKIVEVELSKYAKIIQVTKAPTSMTKLCNPKRRHKESDEEFTARCLVVEHHRQEVLNYIQAKWRAHGEPDNCVVFTLKDFDEWLRSRLPNAFRSDHYGNVAGTNDYANVKLAFVVGRALPGPKAVESGAGMLTGLQVESIIDPDKVFSWYMQTRETITMRDGSGVRLLKHQHPDKTANALLRSILAELLNTLGRIRPWGRPKDKPVTAYLLFDEYVPGLTGLDEVREWPKHFDEMIEGGLVLLSRVDLMRLWPKTFTSERTTFRYIADWKAADGWRRFTCRLQGQRGGKAKVGWYDPMCVPDAQAWLVERLGPLAAYEEGA